MADDRRFKYNEIASKVLKQERSDVARNEPSGESDRVTSTQLRSEMGAALKERAKPQVKSKRKKEEEIVKIATRKAAREAYEDLIKAGATYVPTTKITERVWEAFLTQVSHYLPAVSRDVLTSAAEESLNALKDSERTARDKRKDVEDVVGKLSDEDFRTMMERAEQLTDFVVQVVGKETDPRKSRRKQENEIAIVFEDDDEESKDLPGAEVLDEEEVMEPEVVSSESEDEDTFEGERLHRTRDIDGNDDDDTRDILIKPHMIDAHWLQREISLTTTDPEEAQRLAEVVLTILGERDASARENLLVSNLGFERLDLVKKLVKNHAVIFYCTRVARAKDEPERESIRSEMKEDPTGEGQHILLALAGAEGDVSSSKPRKESDKMTKIESVSNGRKRRIMPSARIIDLNAVVRAQGRQKASEVVLPKGSWSKQTKQWQEVHVRPLKPRPMGENEIIVQISSLPVWMRPAFGGMSSLNRVQSKVFPAIMDPERFNILVSAPTGSGKTNVAMLAVMHEIGQFVGKDNKLDMETMKERLKIVYVAPMKALVQEVVANFSARLTQQFGISVKELSGDQQLSRAEIATTQMIVTTPEKWDVVTRKAGERSFVSSVRLIIIDEIHLLHDSRGAVLEAVVARTLRSNEETKAPCRILGISATLPNYEDVAVFLRVPLDKGLFYFDNSFRPVPLQQVFVGVTDQKAINRMKTMDKVCYEKVSFAAKANQVLVFVHSRKDTVKTAKMMRDTSVELDSQQDFLPPGIHSREVLSRCARGVLTGNEVQDSEIARSADLRDLLPYGFAVHHAGLHRSDRKLVEDLFDGGHVRVLVSTATLAWGVNLPAHTVVIKGTQVYNPEAGDWTELSHLDLLQMLGRAGRPQYDTEGAEGVVITSLGEMQHYLSLLNDQLPVESSLMRRLPDHLNAEIVCGNIADVGDAVNWLGYSFLFTRAIKHPDRYGVTSPLLTDAEDGVDNDLAQWRADLAHAAMLILDKQQLIRYDKKSGVCQSTGLGRISSHYYLSPDTCGAYMKLMESTSTDLDLFRILTTADEFKNVQVRYEEKAELARLVERVPIPIKETLDDPSTKINVLLQAYVSRAALEGYCLACDMVFVHQSAARLARAMFEMALQRNWAKIARRCLVLCISIDRRLWWSQTPLRQMAQGMVGLTEDVFRQLEKRALHFSQYRELSEVELGAKVNPPTLGPLIHKAIRRFPKIDLAARVQTLTRSVLRLELSLTCDFDFHEPSIGPGLLVWILVEDVDGSELLHHQPFLIKSRYSQEEHLISFTVQIGEPTPPFLYVRVEADSFLHCDSSLAVPLGVLTLPPKALPFSELLDMVPVQVASLGKGMREFMDRVYPHVKQLWPGQTQALPLLDGDDSSVLVCCAVGKSILGDLAIVRCFEKDVDARVLFLTVSEEARGSSFEWYKKSFPEKRIGTLLGSDQTSDLETVSNNHLIISTSKTWEALTRRWRQKSRKVVTELSLVVFDDLHAMDDYTELAVARTRYMCAQLERHIRLVGLSAPVTNAEDLAAWMDTKKVINLSPAARPFPTEVVIKGFADQHFDTRLGSMSRPCFRALRRDHITFVFVPTKRHLRLLLIDLVNFATAEQQPYEPLIDMVAKDGLSSELRSALESGVVVLHEGMMKRDFDTAEAVITSETHRCRLAVITARALIKMSPAVRSHDVLLLSTTWFRNKRYEEYSPAMVLKMLNKACLPSFSTSNNTNVQTILCYEPVKDFYKRFLVAGQAVESSLDQVLSDVFLEEIVTKTITTKQDALDFLTWTLFFRRIVKNPSYYGMNLKRLGVVSPEAGLSVFLSDMLERSLDELRDASCLEAPEDEDANALRASPLGMISAFHDVRFSTVDLFASSLQAKTRTAGILEIFSSASEYIEIAAVRAKEEPVLEKLARNAECVVYKLPSSELAFSEAHVKCNILIQAWCSRFPLGPEQRDDLVNILREAPKLLHALVDVSATQSWLKVTLTIIELCQSIVQQVWARDTPLRQVPFFDVVLKERFQQAKLNSVYDVIDMEDDKREQVLSVLNQSQLARVAEFCNAYPSPDISLHSFVDGKEVGDAKRVRGLTAGAEFAMQITINREEDGDDNAGKVVSEKFPHEKTNVWWAILGDDSSNELLAIKRFANDQAKISCVFEQSGSRKLKLYVVCDSYVGCDQVFDIAIDVE